MNLLSAIVYDENGELIKEVTHERIRESEVQTINAVYHEFSGSGTEPGLKFLYQATRGTVELEHVSGVQVAGSFR